VFSKKIAYVGRLRTVNREAMVCTHWVESYYASLMYVINCTQIQSWNLVYLYSAARHTKIISNPLVQMPNAVFTANQNFLVNFLSESNITRYNFSL